LWLEAHGAHDAESSGEDFGGGNEVGATKVNGKRIGRGSLGLGCERVHDGAVFFVFGGGGGECGVFSHESSMSEFGRNARIIFSFFSEVR